MGMGFEYWEVGFEKKLGWEMGLVSPLQDPLFSNDHEFLFFLLNQNSQVLKIRVFDRGAEEFVHHSSYAILGCLVKMLPFYHPLRISK